MIGLMLSRNGIVALAILAVFAWGQITLKNHDEKVGQRAVAQTISKIEATNDAAVTLGKQAAAKSVAPHLPPSRKPLSRRLQPVPGAVLDPTTRDN